MRLRAATASELMRVRASGPDCSAARELSPADLALASEQELAAAQRDWGSLPEYLLAGSRVDVHASCGLSSLCDEGALRLVQDLSVLRE